MTLQDDIDTIYKLEAAQNIFGRDSNVNTFGNFSGDNRAFITAAPLMVSTIRRLESKLINLSEILEDIENMRHEFAQSESFLRLKQLSEVK